MKDCPSTKKLIITILLETLCLAALVTIFIVGWYQLYVFYFLLAPIPIGIFLGINVYLLIKKRYSSIILSVLFYYCGTIFCVYYDQHHSWPYLITICSIFSLIELIIINKEVTTNKILNLIFNISIILINIIMCVLTFIGIFKINNSGMANTERTFVLVASLIGLFCSSLYIAFKILTLLPQNKVNSLLIKIFNLVLNVILLALFIFSIVAFFILLNTSTS